MARNSAKWCFKKLKKPLIVEDSGLFIEKLDGFPGPFSSYVFEKIGNDGIIRLLENAENRKARFVSVVSFAKEGETKSFKGITEGIITKKERGNQGFGYDPIFVPKNTEKSFGEMNIKEKNKFSHRKKAFIKLSGYLASKNI